jgi:hypothetical protein
LKKSIKEKEKELRRSRVEESSLRLKVCQLLTDPKETAKTPEVEEVPSEIFFDGVNKESSGLQLDKAFKSVETSRSK